MSKKTVYKIGDKVKIINPEFVTRVGYPLTPQIVVKEINDNPEQKQIIKDFLSKFEIYCPDPDLALLGTKPDEPKVYNDIVYSLAYHMVHQRGFGGKERRVFTEKREEFLNKEVIIFKKKIVRTGIYHYGRSSSYFGGDYDYEPPYLENVKSHVLLEVYPGPDFMDEIWSDTLGFIEEKNVILCKLEAELV